MSTDTRRLAPRSFWPIVVGGMLTGMGCGSVFGAALMCAVGRSGFAVWGGEGISQLSPYTFAGFMNDAMLVFGVAFCIIMVIGLGRHSRLESKSAH